MLARYLPASLFLLSLGVATQAAAAQPTLIAIGSASGLYEDFAVQTAAPLENGVAGNRFGSLGSGLTYIGGDWFLGLPDRGPNAVGFNGCMDDTVTYINRFQTLHLSLSPPPSDSTLPLPVTLTPMLVGTTLLSSRSPLVYGAGCGSAPVLFHRPIGRLRSVAELRRSAQCAVRCRKHPRLERSQPRLRIGRIWALRVRVRSVDGGARAFVRAAVEVLRHDFERDGLRGDRREHRRPRGEQRHGGAGDHA